MRDTKEQVKRGNLFAALHPLLKNLNWQFEWRRKYIYYKIKAYNFTKIMSSTIVPCQNPTIDTMFDHPKFSLDTTMPLKGLSHEIETG
jgi:hypothetical protein